MYLTPDILEWRDKVPYWLIVYCLPDDDFYRYTNSWGENEKIAVEHADECNLLPWDYTVRGVFRVEDEDYVNHI